MPKKDKTFTIVVTFFIHCLFWEHSVHFICWNTFIILIFFIRFYCIYQMYICEYEVFVCLSVYLVLMYN